MQLNYIGFAVSISGTRIVFTSVSFRSWFGMFVQLWGTVFFLEVWKTDHVVLGLVSCACCWHGPTKKVGPGCRAATFFVHLLRPSSPNISTIFVYWITFSTFSPVNQSSVWAWNNNPCTDLWLDFQLMLRQCSVVLHLTWCDRLVNIPVIVEWW